MNEQDLWIKPLRIQDAKYLQQAKIERLTMKTTSEWHDFIREFNTTCALGHWIIGDLTDPDVPQLMAGLQVLDRQARSARLHIFTSHSSFDIDQAVADIIEMALIKHNLYRLEWHIIEEDLFLWQSSLHNHFWQFAVQLKKSIGHVKSNIHQDVMLYVLHRPLYNQRSTAFVLFQMGVFAITGDDDGLLTARFTHFGTPFSHIWQQESADWLKLLDQNGCLLDISELQTVFPENKQLYLDQSAMFVKQAAQQAAEYFHGSRKEFSLPYQMPNASSFQKKVWLMLAEIPYGTTWTYADIARQVRPDDKNADRTLARAVGNACGANPLPLFLPCHRVIGSDGRLTGFSSGLDIKEYLLAHEFMGLN